MKIQTNLDNPLKRRLKNLSYRQFKELKAYLETLLTEKELYESLCIIMRLVEGLLEELEDVMDIEKRHASTRDAQLTRKIISWIIADCQIARRYLERLEKSQHFSKYLALHYRQKIQQALDKAKEITIRENLGVHNDSM